MCYGNPHHFGGLDGFPVLISRLLNGRLLSVVSVHNEVPLGLRIAALADESRLLLAAVEVEAYSGAVALDVMKAFDALYKVASAGKTLFAGRAASCNVATDSGARSAAERLAAETGEAPAEMARRLVTARRLECLPETRSAVQSGELSEAQTHAVTRGARDGTSEVELLNVARTKSVSDLQQESRRTVVASMSAEEQESRREAARRRRRSRFFVDPDDSSMFRGFITGPVEDLAQIKANMKARQDKVFRAARKAGHRDSVDNYAYDATVELLTSGGDYADTKNTRHQVLLHVSERAFSTGVVRKGDVCETQDGVLVPLRYIYDVIESENPIIRLMVENGHDLSAMASVDGRKITAEVWAVALGRDPCCVNPLCGSDTGVEIDHRRPCSDKGPPTLSNLMGLCRRCHYLKTHKGWCMVGPRGDWVFVKRRHSGDGGIGYPLDRDEDATDYLQATREAEEAYPGIGKLGPYEAPSFKSWEEVALPFV